MSTATFRSHKVEKVTKADRTSLSDTEEGTGDDVTEGVVTPGNEPPWREPEGDGTSELSGDLSIS